MLELLERIRFYIIVTLADFAAWLDEKLERLRGPHTREPK